jgi:hypothetical protein
MKTRWITLLSLGLIVVAGVATAALTASTSGGYTVDYGGSMPTVSGGASHYVQTTESGSHWYSFATSVYHNGAFVASKYISGNFQGPGQRIDTTAASNTTTGVFSAHSSSGYHGSAIGNDSDSTSHSIQTGDMRATD